MQFGKRFDWGAWFLTFFLVSAIVACGGDDKRVARQQEPVEETPVKVATGDTPSAATAGESETGGGANEPDPEGAGHASGTDRSALGIFEAMERALEKIDDYTCVLENFAQEGKETEESTSQLSFKRPHLVRMEMLDGRDKGSVVSRDREGVNRGKAGGVLGMIVVKMKDDDKRLQSVRAIPFYKSDWKTILGELRALVKLDWEMNRLGDETMAGRECYVIEMRGEDPLSNATYQKIWIDKGEELMIRREQYAGKTLVDQDLYRDIRTNTGLDDEHFEL